MFNVSRLYTGRYRTLGVTGTVVIAAAALLLLVWAVRAASREHVPDLKEMQLLLPPARNLALADGESWKPGPRDASGYAFVAGNERFELYVDPDTSGIAVRNKQSGFLWRSNPPVEELRSESVKGTLLTNLKSPFILEYHEEGKTQRLLTNAANKQLATDYRKTAGGLQVTYNFTKLKLQFAVQYELTPYGLEVSIPSKGIQEDGGNFIVSLQVLPFFGATRNGAEDGYLFVPDGPGGLIRFDADRTITGQGYRYPLYGNDLTNPKGEDAVRQTKVSYPVFGLKKGDEAFVAILKEGKFESYVKAQPAGIVSSYNAVDAEWVYRSEYGQRLSKLSAPVNTIQKEWSNRDRTVEYRLLSGSGVGYVEMAAAYREYLQQDGMLQMSMSPGSDIPLELTILGGNSGDSVFGKRYAVSTTFEQAERMIGELADKGVNQMTVTLQGWENGGMNGQTGIFPVERAIGGDGGVERFIARMHEYGYKVMFEHDFVWYSGNAANVTPRDDGIRSMDGTVMLDDGAFAMKPAQSAGRAYAAVNRLKELGADGVVFDNYGSRVYRDHNPSDRMERDDTAYLFGGVMRYAQQQLGSAAAGTGSDYILGDVDRIENMPFESSYDLNIDETVPFYPIVLHGSIPYSFTPGNLRDRYDDHLLKAIEYGAVPSFVLTYEPSIKIRYTMSNDLFSTHYAKWKDRVIDEYRKFEQLSSVSAQRIIGHGKQADGVYATTYEDGTQVLVDYNTKTFRVVKGG